MSTLSHISKTSGMRPDSALVMAVLIIAVPVVLAVICLAARLEIIELSQAVRAAPLFSLLIALY